MFPDGDAALVLACARLCTRRLSSEATKVHDMRRLKAALDDAFIAG